METNNHSGLFTSITMTNPDRYRIAWLPIYEHLRSNSILNPWVVDIGCSNGTAVTHMASYLRQRGINPYIIGIEPVEPVQDKSNFDEFYRMEISIASPLPFSQDSIDVCIAHKLFYNSPGDFHPQNKVLSDIACVLRDKGIFFGDPTAKSDIGDDNTLHPEISYEQDCGNEAIIRYVNSENLRYLIPGADMKRITENIKGRLSLEDVTEFALH